MIFNNSKKDREQIANDKKAIEAKKEELRQREENVLNAEIVVENGFADKRKAKEQELSEFENSERQRITSLLIEEHKSKIDDLKRVFSEKEQEYKVLLNSQKKIFEKNLKDTEEKIDLLRKTADADLNNELNRQKGECEIFFNTQQQECDKYIAEKKKWINDEVEKAKNQIADEYKKFRMKLIAEEEDFNNEMGIKRNNQEAEFEQRRTEFNAQLEKEHKAFDDLAEKTNEKLNQRQADLDKFKAEIDLQTRKAERDAEANANVESRLNDEIDEKVKERKEYYENEMNRMREENGRLIANIESAKLTISIFEELKAELGGEDPAKVLKDLADYKLQIQSLRKELTERPSKEIEELFDDVEKEAETAKERVEKLEEENKAMESTVAETNAVKRENQKLTEDNKLLSDTKANLENQYNKVQEELTRLQASYKDGSERDERIKDIESPYFATPKPIRNKEDIIDENVWLKDIENKIKEAEFDIPQRILYAFHTALKTAEMSPISVLAGVSGTGKSALPQLYSDFGGINFMSLAVQPNWDSQESMLGFFNSIDNKFDAQPVLRLLAQSQKERKDGYPGLSDSLNLILLDEMNLAHIELYFAEFLSKLEERRGKSKQFIPSLAVKLGSGMTPFDLKLGRNVLWCGTMNQDETTKSLSDKVLDRGIIINFPRPETLKSRQDLKKLHENKKDFKTDLLSIHNWDNWLKWESILKPEEKTKYRGFIEDMNKHLANAGRALGHRVWQSIEYYMSNYPIFDGNRDQALQTAFEDQLVQKVMPKLRGIETRGKTKTECLDKIKKQLNDNYPNLKDDFEFACEFGNGQFTWNSAYYLGEKISKVETTQKENMNE